MATPDSAVRATLADIQAKITGDIAAAAQSVPLERQADTAIAATRLIVPAYYDASGALAVAWYDELRSEANPTSVYVPSIIGDPETDWIEREVTAFRETLDAADLERETAALVAQTARLAGKETARGFRDSITGNTRQDEDAVGWSRVVRAGACKFCVMLADRGAVYRESTATFAAHTSCNCGARPEFRNGDYGPEANAIQYLASSKRARSETAQAARNARVRDYLNEFYPDLPG